MTRKCTPNWIDTYLRFTTFQEAPEKFHLWTALSTIASAVRRSVCLPRGYFNIYPNLYVAIVGPTGITKTTSADIGIELLEEVKDMELMKGGWKAPIRVILVYEVLIDAFFITDLL